MIISAMQVMNMVAAKEASSCREMSEASPSTFPHFACWLTCMCSVGECHCTSQLSTLETGHLSAL